MFHAVPDPSLSRPVYRPPLSVPHVPSLCALVPLPPPSRLGPRSQPPLPCSIPQQQFYTLAACTPLLCPATDATLSADPRLFPSSPAAYAVFAPHMGRPSFPRGLHARQAPAPGLEAVRFACKSNDAHGKQGCRGSSRVAGWELWGMVSGGGASCARIAQFHLRHHMPMLFLQRRQHHGSRLPW